MASRSQGQSGKSLRKETAGSVAEKYVNESLLSLSAEQLLRNGCGCGDLSIM